jgi:hypothetical protein
MEREILLPLSRELAAGPCSQPEESSPLLPILSTQEGTNILNCKCISIGEQHIREKG